MVCSEPEFENVERSTVSVGRHEGVSRFQWISHDARIKYTCQAGFTTSGETSGSSSECVYEKSGASFKEFRPVIFVSGGFRGDFTQNSLLAAYSPDFFCTF